MKNRQLFFVCGMSLGIVTAMTVSAGAGCLASTREIAFSDGSAKMKVYSCSLSEGGEPVLQVEFDRLSEAAAGSLVEGSPNKELKKLYGKWRILRNGVFNEARSLFDGYGKKIVEANCGHVFSVSSAQSGGNYSSSEGSCNEESVLWYLTFPQASGYTLDYADSWKPKLTKGGWPSGWNFSTRNAITRVLLSCFFLWRPIRWDDIKNYKKDIVASELKLGACLSG